MTAEVLSRLVLVGGLLLIVIRQASFLPIVIVVTMAATVYTFYLWLRSPGIKFCFDKIIAKDILKKIWLLKLTSLRKVLSWKSEMKKD